MKSSCKIGDDSARAATNSGANNTRVITNLRRSQGWGSGSVSLRSAIQIAAGLWAACNSFGLKFTAPGIDAHFRPLNIRPEVLAFYLHFRARVWLRRTPVAFAGVLIFTSLHKILTLSAFLIRIHLWPLFMNTCFLVSRYRRILCLSSKASLILWLSAQRRRRESRRPACMRRPSPALS